MTPPFDDEEIHLDSDLSDDENQQISIIWNQTYYVPNIYFNRQNQLSLFQMLRISVQNITQAQIKKYVEENVSVEGNMVQKLIKLAKNPPTMRHNFC